MNTTADLYLYANGAPQQFSDWTDNTIVILSGTFFYMICYLIHKWIEDWVKIWNLRRVNKKLYALYEHSKEHPEEVVNKHNKFHKNDSST